MIRSEDKRRTSERVEHDERRDVAAENAALVEEANNTANITSEDGSVEAQGKLAVPYVEVTKRGNTKVTDKETGKLLKTTVKQENEDVEVEEPEYLRLHREVVEGADPIEATLEYQKSAEELREDPLVPAPVQPVAEVQPPHEEDSNSVGEE